MFFSVKGGDDVGDSPRTIGGAEAVEGNRSMSGESLIDDVDVSCEFLRRTCGKLSELLNQNIGFIQLCCWEELKMFP